MNLWEDDSFNYDDFSPTQELVDYYVQEDNLLPPSTAKRKLFGDTQTQDGDACQTGQNQPKLPEIQAIHINDDHLGNQLVLQPSRNVNILPNGTDTTPTTLTREERKRITDRNYRQRKKEKEKDFQEKYNDLLEKKIRVSRENAQLKNVMEQKFTRKELFKLNFHDHESKKKVLNVVVDLPDIDYFLLKWEEGILKLKGRFDTEAVLHKLNKVCPTHLLSKRYAIVEPSMPGTSTAAKSPPPMHFR